MFSHLLMIAAVVAVMDTDSSSAGDSHAPFPALREVPDDPYMPYPANVADPVPPFPLGKRSFGVQVNVDEFGNNIPGDAANETSIAVDPTDPSRLVIGWRQFDTIESNFRQAGWGYSHDGGLTWTFPGIIEPGVFRTDPVLRPDAEGTIYYCSQKVVDNVDSVQFFKSIDGGVTWGPAFEAFGGDKSWFAIDQTGGIGHGNIYLYWSFFSCCGSNVFTRSTDDAQSFMEPIPLFAEPKIGQLALSSDGVLYVAGFMPGLGQEGQRVAFLGSTNAQDPAQTPVFDIATPVDMGPTALLAGPNPAGLLGQVNLAVDTSGGPTHGNIYLLVSADPPGSDPVDVMFARSTDGGVTFSEPVRINDDVGDDAWQWFGTLSVAPNGRLDVVWNDTRNSGVENVSELFYASSRNGGETWSPNVALSPPWDSHIGWPQQDKIGDYYDMASDDGGAHLAWAATFNGEQDVYYLRINDCPWDCANGDGQIDIVEFLAVLSLWGTGHIDEPCDFDGDGEVGINEFLTVLGMWGPCP